MARFATDEYWDSLQDRVPSYTEPNRRRIYRTVGAVFGEPDIGKVLSSAKNSEGAGIRRVCHPGSRRTERIAEWELLS